jgi:hypothetical protein
MGLRVMATQFCVTFETITPESAKHGDFASHGFIAKGVGLREAIDNLGFASRGVEADCYPVEMPRWFTAYRVGENYTTGETENRALHLPDHLTNATRLRIARLLGCHGA